MFDLSSARISRLSLHFLDHSADESKLLLTENCVSLTDSFVHELITQYTLGPFANSIDFLRFKDVEGDLSSNPLYTIISQVFDRSEPFHEVSKRIARHLFQSSGHPGIKSGDLFVAWISDISHEDELIDAIGIFKSEQKEDFLKLFYQGEHSSITADQGINVSKLDKGCIIYNTGGTEGYVISSIDRTSKNFDAQYWNDTFLRITSLDDAFHRTEQYMNMAQTYVSHKLGEDFGLKKGDQLGILHDAGQFFKTNRSYDQSQFEQEVLGGSPEVIASFQNYKQAYTQELQVDLPDQFAISNLAVKRSAKDFKSVLKLDKNFHVYIHGNRQMIEHGVDTDGRKFYKLFYEVES